MTPKEKAEELHNMFNDVIPMDARISDSVEEVNHMLIRDHNATKECALIAVKEMILAEPRFPNNVDWDDVGGTHQYYYEAEREEANKYWNEVLTEIEKL